MAKPKLKLKPQLRRYTDLPAVISMLKKQAITLLSPETWDDKNDSYYLELYKKKKKLKSLLALCFTEDPETYHHWKIFAPGPGGVCVIFNAARLKAVVEDDDDAIMKRVKYIRLADHRQTTLSPSQLLNSKRYGFLHEHEVRILFRSEKKLLGSHDMKVPLAAIERINLSPWLHPSLVGGVRDLLRTIPGCSSIKIYHSTLINNEEWRQLGDAA